jgi:hypothetical protein
MYRVILRELFKPWLWSVPLAITRHNDIVRVRVFGLMLARIELAN